MLSAGTFSTRQIFLAKSPWPEPLAPAFPDCELRQHCDFATALPFTLFADAPASHRGFLAVDCAIPTPLLSAGNSGKPPRYDPTHALWIMLKFAEVRSVLFIKCISLFLTFVGHVEQTCWRYLLVLANRPDHRNRRSIPLSGSAVPSGCFVIFRGTSTRLPFPDRLSGQRY